MMNQQVLQHSHFCFFLVGMTDWIVHRDHAFPEKCDNMSEEIQAAAAGNGAFDDSRLPPSCSRFIYSVEPTRAREDGKCDHSCSYSSLSWHPKGIPMTTVSTNVTFYALEAKCKNRRMSKKGRRRSRKQLKKLKVVFYQYTGSNFTTDRFLKLPTNKKCFLGSANSLQLSWFMTYKVFSNPNKVQQTKLNPLGL